MMRTIATTLLLTVSTAVLLTAQQAVTRVEGVITDDATGWRPEPRADAAELEFRGPF